MKKLVLLLIVPLLLFSVLVYSYSPPQPNEVASKLEKCMNGNYVYTEKGTLYATQHTDSGIENIMTKYRVYLEKKRNAYMYKDYTEYYVNNTLVYRYSIEVYIKGNVTNGYVEINGTKYDFNSDEWENSLRIPRDELVKWITQSYHLKLMDNLITKSNLQLAKKTLFSGYYTFEGNYKGNKIQLKTNREISEILMTIYTPYGSKIFRNIKFLG